MDKEQTAMERLRLASDMSLRLYHRPLLLTDSGGKDSAVVSNPPFSRKKEILQRLKDLNLPFALILPFLFLNDGVPLDYGHQIILFRKRVHFIIPEIGELNKPRTNCFVLSNGILKNDFTIERK